MRILTNKNKHTIAKMLAAIYYTAVHWENEKWEDFVSSIVSNCANIACLVGGEDMMCIEVPCLVDELNWRLQKKEESKT